VGKFIRREYTANTSVKYNLLNREFLKRERKGKTRMERTRVCSYIYYFAFI